jgi:hypothetical protein
MLRRVAPVRTNISEELSASIIRVTRIGELGTTLAVTNNRRTLRHCPDDGGAKFLWNVSSYKSYTVIANMTKLLWKFKSNVILT